MKYSAVLFLFGELHRIEHLKNCIKYNWEKSLFHYCSSQICVVFFPNHTVTNQSSYPNRSGKQKWRVGHLVALHCLQISCSLLWRMLFFFNANIKWPIFKNTLNIKHHFILICLLKWYSLTNDNVNLVDC